MTISEIHKQAEERYKLGKGACRLERLRVRELKRKFIEKMMKQYNLSEEKVN